MMRVDSLTKTHPGAAAPTLRALSLEAATGSLVAILGRSCAGKSTFLKMASGLLDPSDGTVTIAGHAAGTPDARAAVSYVPDEPVLYDDLSVAEHLRYVAAMHGADVSDETIAELVGRLGLADRVDDLPARFSRGLRQKAGLAVALIRPFSVLLVDEPTKGLAPALVAEVARVLERLAELTTVLLVEQNLGVVRRIAHDAIVLDQDRVVHTSDARELLEQPELVRRLLSVGSHA